MHISLHTPFEMVLVLTLVDFSTELTQRNQFCCCCQCCITATIDNLIFCILAFSSKFLALQLIFVVYRMFLQVASKRYYKRRHTTIVNLLRHLRNCIFVFLIFVFCLLFVIFAFGTSSHSGDFEFCFHRFY